MMVSSLPSRLYLLKRGGSCVATQRCLLWTSSCKLNNEQKESKNDETSWLSNARSWGASQSASVRQRLKGDTWLGSLQSKENDAEWYSKRVSFWMRQYEDFVGLTEVKAAQANVVGLERKFIESQDARRETQNRLNEVQQKVKEIHTELEKTHRGEDKYLTLVTQEHQILKEERTLLGSLSLLERTERECFTALSNAVRDSHEKERAQAEKTKYWSLLGSILGTCIGILGTTINNRLRMRELRELVTKSASGERLVLLTDQMDKSFSEHKHRMNELVARVETVVVNAQESLLKFGEVRTISEALRAVSEQMNTRDIEKSLSKLQNRIDESFKTLFVQHKGEEDLLHRLHTLAEELPTANFVERLVVERTRETRDSATEASDNCRNAVVGGLQEVRASHQNNSDELLKRLSQIDGRVDELGTILKKLQLASVHRRKKERELLESLDESLLDKIDNSLEEHAAKTRNHVSKWAFLLLVSTSLVVCVTNQLLK